MIEDIQEYFRCWEEVRLKRQKEDREYFVYLHALYEYNDKINNSEANDYVESWALKDNILNMIKTDPEGLIKLFLEKYVRSQDKEELEYWQLLKQLQ